MTLDYSTDPVRTRPTRGAYHRRTIAVAEPGIVRAAVEDEAHHFRVTLHHDGKTVTAAEGRAVRFPWDSCSGALAKLDHFVGEEISLRRGSQIEARTHCTHQYDLARFAIAQAARFEAGLPGTRQYDLRLLDRVHTNFRAEIRCDHRLVMHWEMDGAAIIGPLPYAGMDTRKRLDWGVPSPDPDLVEAALMLRRGLMIARSRDHDNVQFRLGWGPDLSPREEGHAPGVCHTYSDEFIDSARTRNSWVDFSWDANLLLADFPGVRKLPADLAT